MILRRYHIKDLFGTLNCMNREKGTFADTCAVGVGWRYMPLSVTEDPRVQRQNTIGSGDK